MVNEPSLRRLSRREKISRLAMTTVAAISVIALLVSGFVWQQSAQRANQQALSLADEVAIACAKEGVNVGGRDLCEKAEETRAGVDAGPMGPTGPEGPQGRQGDTGPQGQRGPKGDPGQNGEDGANGSAGQDGTDGQNGEDSDVPGPPGEAGADGADSDVPGPTGPPGPAGKDSTVPGPRGPAGAPGEDGADSTVPGPAGPTGPAGPAGSPGADGVGIKTTQCVGEGSASHWSLTLTNGQTITANGPCKVSVTPAEPSPTPTD